MFEEYESQLVGTYLQRIYKSALSGNVKDLEALGDAFFYGGNGAKQSYPDAFRFYYVASKKGNISAQFKLSDLFFNGNGVGKSNKSAFKWLLESAKGGYEDSFLKLGKMYLYGHGTQQSFSDAIKWINLASQNGDLEADSILDKIYENSLDENQDSDDDIIVTSAYAGNERAQKALIKEFLENGWCEEVSTEEIIEWIHEMAIEGDVESQINLARMYHDGNEVELSNELAMYWYQQAAQQDS